MYYSKFGSISVGSYNDWTFFACWTCIDILALSLVVVLPLAIISVISVRFFNKPTLHKKLQILITAILALSLLIFEIEVRVWGWQHQSYESAYKNSWLYVVLFIHIAIACSTLLIWLKTFFTALKRPTHKPLHDHKKWGYICYLGLVSTYLSGLIFYMIAFVY